MCVSVEERVHENGCSESPEETSESSGAESQVQEFRSTR